MTLAVGFLGAGSMGSGMVRRLLLRGFTVTVWERTPGRHAALAALGAHCEPRLDRVVEQCDIVIGCLLNTAVTRECYLGEPGAVDGERGGAQQGALRSGTHGAVHGALHAARRGQVFVDHGTFDPQLADALATAAARHGASFLDAPVTGGPDRAASGDLVTMVGGDAHALEQVRATLEAYCSRIERVGGSGSGQRLKLINQLLVSVHVVAAAEASALLLRSGIDPQIAHRVLMGGWAASAMLDRELPRACASDFGNSGATVGKLVEVQPLISAFLQESHVPAPMFDQARVTFDEAVHRGAGDLDLAAIVMQYLEPGGPGHGHSREGSA